MQPHALRSRAPADGPTTLELGGTPSHLSISGDGLRVIVGCETSLKVVNVSGRELVEEASIMVDPLRRGYVSTDVAWHKHEAYPTMVAMGTMTGHICLWNLQRLTQPERTIKSGHTRRVSRLAWSKLCPSRLLSCSHDSKGQVRMWDWQHNARSTWQCDCSGDVLDVQFDPFRESRFAAALEDGTLELWDVRMGRVPQRRFKAHEMYMHCVDWHPTELGVLCTSGGRDRTIRVYATDPPPLGSAAHAAEEAAAKEAARPAGGNAAPRKLHTFQTAFPVSLAIWRPGNRPSQVGACASATAGDSRVCVWDVRAPHLPVRVVDAVDSGHPLAMPSAFLWSADGDSLLWCTPREPASLMRRTLSPPAPAAAAARPSAAGAPRGRAERTAGLAAAGCDDEREFPHRTLPNVAIAWGKDDVLTCAHAPVDRMSDSTPLAPACVGAELGREGSGSGSGGREGGGSARGFFAQLEVWQGAAAAALAASAAAAEAAEQRRPARQPPAGPPAPPPPPSPPPPPWVGCAPPSSAASPVSGGGSHAASQGAGALGGAGAGAGGGSVAGIAPCLSCRQLPAAAAAAAALAAPAAASAGGGGACGYSAWGRPFALHSVVCTEWTDAEPQPAAALAADVGSSGALGQGGGAGGDGGGGWWRPPPPPLLAPTGAHRAAVDLGLPGATDGAAHIFEGSTTPAAAAEGAAAAADAAAAAAAGGGGPPCRQPWGQLRFLARNYWLREPAHAPQSRQPAGAAADALAPAGANADSDGPTGAAAPGAAADWAAGGCAAVCRVCLHNSAAAAQAGAPQLALVWRIVARLLAADEAAAHARDTEERRGAGGREGGWQRSAGGAIGGGGWAARGDDDNDDEEEGGEEEGGNALVQLLRRGDIAGLRLRAESSESSGSGEEGDYDFGSSTSFLARPLRTAAAGAGGRGGAAAAQLGARSGARGAAAGAGAPGAWQRASDWDDLAPRGAVAAAVADSGGGRRRSGARRPARGTWRAQQAPGASGAEAPGAGGRLGAPQRAATLCRSCTTPQLSALATRQAVAERPLHATAAAAPDAAAREGGGPAGLCLLIDRPQRAASLAASLGELRFGLRGRGRGGTGAEEEEDDDDDGGERNGAAAAAAAAPSGLPAAPRAASRAERGARSLAGAYARIALDELSARGDVQSCAVLCTVLAAARPRELVEPRAAAGWVRAYLELLHRLRLFCQAAELVSCAAEQGVHELSQLSTTVALRCGACEAKVEANGPPRCAKCRAPSAAGERQPRECGRCAVCRQPVRGVYSWCVGCGHGGHLEHMRGWFADGNVACPAACGHRCTEWRVPAVQPRGRA